MYVLHVNSSKLNHSSWLGSSHNTRCFFSQNIYFKLDNEILKNAIWHDTRWKTICNNGKQYSDAVHCILHWSCP